MRETILHTELPIDECRKHLASATTPWPSYGTAALKTMLAVGQQNRVIMKQNDQCYVLALEKYGTVNLPFYRGIGFRLACVLSAETRYPGTRISCRLNTFLFWRVLACSVFVCFAALASFRGTGSFMPGFWIITLAAVFVGLLMPSFLDDRSDLIAFLKKALNASEVEPTY